MNRKKQWVLFMTSGLSAGGCLLFLMAFFVAFIFSPDFAVTMEFNLLGEAMFELILFSLTLVPAMILSPILTYKWVIE